MNAVSLIDEVTVTPEMIARITVGENITMEDQIWIFMQAIGKFTDVLDAVPDEHRDILDSQLVTDAVSMVIIAARADEREQLRGYITGETDGTELDGPEEAESLEEV